MSDLHQLPLYKICLLVVKISSITSQQCHHNQKLSSDKLITQLYNHTRCHWPAWPDWFIEDSHPFHIYIYSWMALNLYKIHNTMLKSYMLHAIAYLAGWIRLYMHRPEIAKGTQSYSKSKIGYCIDNKQKPYAFAR